mmetsp:Transcript_39534/g.91387  ORF Transcript_39534/g.91387 Transcript_39534/m.91387 type:complete len:377 (-) Transcript_39534:92-1222(-)
MPTPPPPPASGAFVDHYEVLGCAPESSPAELKRAYHEKLREYHPDKRPESRGETGGRVTQAVLDAWATLQDPEKRKAYDALWGKMRREQSAAEHAEACRRQGNELYKEAQALSKTSGPDSLSAATAALTKYQAAIDKYTEGIDLAPQDHRIRSNRALCYSALKDWAKCKEDATAVVDLKPDFMKGWFLLAKALWKEGSPVMAQRHLESALQVLPGCAELIALQDEMAIDVQAAAGGDLLPPVQRSRSSRNVSPACTPVQGNSRSGSRVATPPPVRGASKSSASGRHRSSSRPRYQSSDWDETARFGEAEADRTAHFGEFDVSHSGRSTSPIRPPPPPPGASPANPAPPPREPSHGHRTKPSSLAGMAASSRLGVPG